MREQVVRWRENRNGRPRGSVAGLARPASGPALAVAPPELSPAALRGRHSGGPDVRGVSAGVALLLLSLSSAFGCEDPPKPPPVWSGKAEASYVATSGNSDAKTLGAAGEVAYVPGIWNFKLSLAFIRSESEGVESARTIDALLRAARKLTPRLELYGQGAYRENRFAGIDHQWAGDAGAAYQFLSGDPHSLKVEAGSGTRRKTRLPPGAVPADGRPQLSDGLRARRTRIQVEVLENG